MTAAHFILGEDSWSNSESKNADVSNAYQV